VVATAALTPPDPSVGLGGAAVVDPSADIAGGGVLISILEG